MFITKLTQLDALQGGLILTFVLISTILGIFIMLKYVKYKRRELLLVGITWILIVSPYWPDAINFLMILWYGTLLNIRIYLFLAIAFIPIIHITWIMAFTDFLYKDKQKFILLFFTAEAILFEIFYLYFLIVNPSFLGTQLTPFDVELVPLIEFYLIFSIMVFLITGLLFARECLQAKNNEIQLKGKFLAIAFISFAICAFIDVLVSLTEITISIFSAVLVFSGLMFYIGFTLPRFIKEIFLREA